MSYKMNEKQFAAVLALPAKERYGHFISRVADWEEVWGLRSGDGWSLAGDKDQAAFPLWPHEEYAKACTTGDWSDAAPEAIDLVDMMLLLDKLEQQGLSVAVFPTPQGRGVVVSPADLRQHLDTELQQFD